MLELLVDPLLRGPFIGSIFTGVACALVGVCLSARKQLLIGETLAHASWPGVALAGLILGGLNVGVDKGFGWVLALAGLFAFVAFKVVGTLTQTMRLKKDSALCLVLSSFFSVGLLIVSGMQLLYPVWHRQIQSLLFGELASISQSGVLVSSFLSLVVIGALYLLYKEIQTVSFDRGFAKVSNIKMQLINRVIIALTVLASIIGMKSVGVVLMSGLLIGPALGSEPFTNKLSSRFFLAPLFAVIGTTLGHLGALYFSQLWDVPVPTGPLIVLALTVLALISNLVAPKGGYISRWLRRRSFLRKSREENTLKHLWHVKFALPLGDFCIPGASRYKAKRSISNLIKKGQIDRDVFNEGLLQLTSKGHKRAQRLVRLHRLWEEYLSTYFEMSHARAHYNAEQIEHILTPELEKELETLLESREHSLHSGDIPEKIGENFPYLEAWQ